MNKWLSYTFLITLLLLSTAPFLYNRATSTYRTVKSIVQTRNTPQEYRQNDRYNTINLVVAKYPDYPIYFLSTSTNPKEKSTSWQLIQTNYLLYPKTVIQLQHTTDIAHLSILSSSQESAIIISPFKQESFSRNGTEMHPHDEYYIYIMTRK